MAGVDGAALRCSNRVTKFRMLLSDLQHVRVNPYFIPERYFLHIRRLLADPEVIPEVTVAWWVGKWRHSVVYHSAETCHGIQGAQLLLGQPIVLLTTYGIATERCLGQKYKIIQNNLIHINFKNSTLHCIVIWLYMAVSRTRLLNCYYFYVCVLLFLPHWLLSFYLFLSTVSLLAIRLPFFNKLELSWVEDLVLVAIGALQISAVFLLTVGF